MEILSTTEPIAGALKKCLVVDDEPAICQTITFALDTEGWDVRSCGDLQSGRKAVKEEPFDLALVDLRLGRNSGLDLLQDLQSEQPDVPVVIITAYASIPSAVSAIRRGATDYLPKPFQPADLRRAVAKALASRTQQLRDKALNATALLESRVPVMQTLLKRALTVARARNTTVLLQGETGTGKGVLAKAVHDHSPRKNAPFVVVSCPGLPQELLESELFGHERGAFSGAYRDHPGRIAQAEGGTLFLDEIGDLPLTMQSKLLRVLQEKEYERLGNGQTIKADVRIVSATHVDLAEAVKAGRFREDLYYRLSAVELYIPPLRSRIDDLPDLIDVMLEEIRKEVGRGPKRLSSNVMSRLRTYPWPGNLRELRGLLERVCVLGGSGEVQLEELSGLYETPRNQKPTEKTLDLASMGDVEEAHIRAVISQTKTLEQAAQVLGVSGVTLWRKRKKYKV